MAQPAPIAPCIALVREASDALRRGWMFVSCDVRDLVRPGFAITPEQAIADAR